MKNLVIKYLCGEDSDYSVMGFENNSNGFSFKKKPVKRRSNYIETSTSILTE